MWFSNSGLAGHYLHSDKWCNDILNNTSYWETDTLRLGISDISIYGVAKYNRVSHFVKERINREIFWQKLR